jgi:hypothetical protein
MVNRVFLTLLALLTGLAAPIGPVQAHARVQDSAQVSVSFAARGQASQQRRQGWLARPQQRFFAFAEMCVAAGLRSAVPAVSCVMVGVDRARE